MSGLNYSAKVVMSVANEVLTMCRRGESCLERRCWSEPALCCYSGGQNDRCAVVLLGRTSIMLRCYTVGGQNKRCVGGHRRCTVVLQNERWATMIKDGGSATKSTVTAPPTREMQVQSCTQFRRN